MQLSLTYYSLGVTILFCKFWFENDTFIQVRYCHLLGIWCVFLVYMLISSFVLILHDKIYVYVLIVYYQTKHNTFILKCFIQFTCTNLDASQKEGFPPEKGGGFKHWRKLCYYNNYI